MGKYCEIFDYTLWRYVTVIGFIKSELAKNKLVLEISIVWVTTKGCLELGVVADTCNTSTRESKAEL